jgi:hypothetical protein
LDPTAGSTGTKSSVCGMKTGALPFVGHEKKFLFAFLRGQHLLQDRRRKRTKDGGQILGDSAPSFQAPYRRSGWIPLTGRHFTPSFVGQTPSHRGCRKRVWNLAFFRLRGGQGPPHKERQKMIKSFTDCEILRPAKSSAPPPQKGRGSWTL